MLPEEAVGLLDEEGDVAEGFVDGDEGSKKCQQQKQATVIPTTSAPPIAFCPVRAHWSIETLRGNSRANI